MNKNDYTIRLERKEDHREVENLIREAFWNVYRPGCVEHYVAHCYRDDKDFVPKLNFVMEKEDKIIGQVMYVRAKIEEANGNIIPIMTFGPISILPEYKRRGYGKALVDYSMEKAKKLGVGAIAITGNIEFYGKSGFVFASSKGIRYKFAEANDDIVPYFLIKELAGGFLNEITGTYKDPDGYFVADKNPEKFEQFEARFPKKEKLKLPGQLI